MNAFSFDRHAAHYPQNAHIQDIIAKDLLARAMSGAVKSVLDLGAGSGAIAHNLAPYHISRFVALDKSRAMLSYHPRNLAHIVKIEILAGDFESYDFSEKFDLIIASSSLHWAKNLSGILAKIPHDSRVAFSFFTDKSLSNLHNFLGSKSPLRSEESLRNLLARDFMGESWVENFTLDFATPSELLTYLRHCGLLGGGEIPYQAKKRLKFGFTLRNAAFEVLFFVGRKVAKN